MAKAPLRETDLYGPLKAFLEKQGYTVRGEVRGCDVAAVKDGEVVLIELKTRFSVELLMQATERQRRGDSVYMAVPYGEAMKSKARWRGVRRLVRRLELGLILINPAARTRKVQIAVEPAPYAKRKDAKARRAVIAEVAARSGDYNDGGSNKRKLMTAYREQALYLACCLERFGPLSPKKLRELGGAPKASAILYTDVYGWFVRVERGVYALRPAGHAALTEYGAIVESLRQQVPET